MPEGKLLVDANVLIDYQKSDLSVLTMANAHIGRIYVHLDVLQEVRKKSELSDKDCERHNLTIIDTIPQEQFQLFINEQRSLSFTDKICLAVAKNCCILLTNDDRLRKACDKHGVETMWGLELMVRLVVDKKQLTASDAIAVALFVKDDAHAGLPFSKTRKI